VRPAKQLTVTGVTFAVKSFATHGLRRSLAVTNFGQHTSVALIKTNANVLGFIKDSNPNISVRPELHISLSYRSRVFFNNVTPCSAKVSCNQKILNKSSIGSYTERYREYPVLVHFIQN
jgi:hypothetical protein